MIILIQNSNQILDLYIPYKCMFWIGGEVGIQMTSKTFRKPIVCVNRVPMFANNLSAGILKKKMLLFGNIIMI